jgi:hypothetical protein
LEGEASNSTSYVPGIGFGQQVLQPGFEDIENDQLRPCPAGVVFEVNPCRWIKWVGVILM